MRNQCIFISAYPITKSSGSTKKLHPACIPHFHRLSRIVFFCFVSFSYFRSALPFNKTCGSIVYEYLAYEQFSCA